MALELEIGIGVNGDRHRLAGTHLGELAFLIIRRHPNLRRDQRENLLPGRHVGADLDIALGDPAILRGRDDRIGQIEQSLIEPGFRLIDLAVELRDLRNGLGDALRHGRCLLDLRLRAGDLRLRLPQAGRGCIDLLLGRRTRRQRLLPIIIGLRTHEQRLGRVQLRLCRVELRREVFLRHLGGILEAAILTFGRRQIGLGVLDIDHILAIVDVDQRLTLFHEFVIAHVQRDDIARDLRGDRDCAAVDEGIVRGFKVSVGQPVFVTREGEAAEQEEEDDPHRRAPLLLRGRRGLRLGDRRGLRRRTLGGAVLGDGKIGVGAGFGHDDAPQRSVRRNSFDTDLPQRFR